MEEEIKFDGFLKYFKNQNIEKLVSSNGIVGGGNIVDVIMNGSLPKDVKKVVYEVSKNVVGISNEKGLPFATGLLLCNEFVLTSTDMISPPGSNDDDEEMDKCLSVCFGFEKTLIKLKGNAKVLNEIMDYGTHVAVDYIYEYNSEIGYCILKLSETIPDSYQFKKSLILNGRIDNPLDQQQLFYFNHPNGSGKNVTYGNPSTVINLKSNSVDGESGAVYTNENGVIIGINTIVGEGSDAPTPSFKFLNLKNIMSNSKLLKELYSVDGSLKEVNFCSLPLNGLIVISSRDKLIKVTRGTFPGPKANANNHTNPYIQFSYHHIIPAGSMEFLWMLSKEFDKLSSVLSDIYNHDAAINYTVWSKFNLFQGPSLRYHENELLKLLAGQPDIHGWDPENNVEPYKPLSFDSSQWEFVQDFNLAIEQCWLERSKITHLSKQQTIRYIDQNYRNPEFKEITIEQISTTPTEQYINSLTILFNKLDKSKLWLSNITQVFQFNPDDWIQVKKFYLK